MPLKINVGVARKESKDYNSKGYSLNIEAELPANLIDDANGLADATNRLYQLADDIIDERIRLDRGDHLVKPAQHDDVPAKRTAAHDPAPERPYSNGRSTNSTNTGRKPAAQQPEQHQQAPAERPAAATTSGRGITQAQLKAIRAIAGKQQQDPDTLAHEEFGVSLNRLSIRQASELIGLLKGETTSTAGGRR